MSTLLCCFGKAEPELEKKPGAYNVTEEEAAVPATQLVASRTAETDVFDETANNQHAAALYNRLVVQQQRQGSLRRSLDANSAGSEEPSGRMTGRISTHEANELWEKLGKMSFVDAGDNGLCDRLFLGLSRVKALGSGGFASVFQARWRHVRIRSSAAYPHMHAAAQWRTLAELLPGIWLNRAGGGRIPHLKGHSHAWARR